MRRLRWSFALAISALAFALAGCGGEPEGVEQAPAAGAPHGEATFSPDEPTELWFVELGEPSRVRGGDPALQADERIRFERAAVDVGLRYRRRLSFDRLWNGLSVQVAAGAGDALAAMPGVRAIFPVVEVLPELATATAMTGADIVRTELGFTGEKVLVGVIDSGIDYHHPDLGGCFGDGCRVRFGTDFVGDDYNATIPITSYPVPDDDPDDCSGHGTHVAGIVGAKGVLQGVAPDVILGAYRVFGCTGGTANDMILQAMERASIDGMRVVNMSIGSTFEWPEYPTGVAADALADSGVVVVASAGNAGSSGLWAVAAPSGGDRVISVAAIQNTHASRLSFTISPDDLRFGYQSSSGVPHPPLSGSAPLVRTGAITSTNDACDPLPAGSLTGAVALIRRSGCTFDQKAANAQAAGAVGVVFYNHIATPIAPILNDGVVTIPAVIVSQIDGETINARLDLEPVTLTWTDDVALVTNPAANQISTTSSYGPTASLGFKPDIAAPGGPIFSTVPLEEGAWNIMGGTSMSSPHVAGAVALLIDARPDLPLSKVRDLLQNTAVPVTWSGDLASGVPDNTYRQGAGMLRIDRAIASQVMITPGKLALGESQAGPHVVTLTLQNVGAVAVTYQISHVPGVSTPSGDHYAPQHVIGGAAAVQLGAASVTVPAGGTATAQATITADAALANGSLYGGWLVFTPDGGTADDALRVPYAGFKGDYQALTVLTPADQGYPWIGRRSGSTYTKQESGAVFTVQSSDTSPYLVAHLHHASRRFLMDAYEATTMKPWGNIRDVSYQAPNGAANSTFKYLWNGTTTLNKSTVLVPNGEYVIQVRVLKALGDENDPAHWETWTSSVIRINHP